ncbi:MAG: hypothetical protein RQ751_12545, partial [Longimicrobiales bacterium]|nr:hypothetical protein [Longimicrobiales bacterium]
MHAARADGALYELASRRVRVLLTGTRGVERVEGDGTGLAADVRIATAAGANLLVGPRAAVRECFTRAGSLREAVQLPHALPGAVLQWAAPRDGSGAGGLRLDFRLLPDADPGPLRLHRAPGLLWAARGDAGVLACLPGAASLPEVRCEGGALEVAWELPPATPGTPATLLLQAAPPEGGWTSLEALAAVAAHHRLGEDHAAGAGEAGVEVETGVAALDEGVRWIRAWLRDRVWERPGAPPELRPLTAPLPPLPPVARSTLPMLPALPALPELDADLARPGVPPLLPAELAAWAGPELVPAWVAVAAAASGDREAARAALISLPDGGSPRGTRLAEAARRHWTAWTGEAPPRAGPTAPASGGSRAVTGAGGGVRLPVAGAG